MLLVAFISCQHSYVAYLKSTWSGSSSKEQWDNMGVIRSPGEGADWEQPEMSHCRHAWQQASAHSTLLHACCWWSTGQQAAAIVLGKPQWSNSQCPPQESWFAMILHQSQSCPEKSLWIWRVYFLKDYTQLSDNCVDVPKVFLCEFSIICIIFDCTFLEVALQMFVVVLFALFWLCMSLFNV